MILTRKINERVVCVVVVVVLLSFVMLSSFDFFKINPVAQRINV